MKQLENHSKVSKEIRVVKPIQKQKQLLDTLHPHRGHQCFEINTISGEINLAIFESSDVHFNLQSGGYVQKKLMTKENHVYITALNKDNALKKYLKSKK